MLDLQTLLSTPFLKIVNQSVHRNWEAALLGNHTNSVAEMIVDGSASSAGLFVKELV